MVIIICGEDTFRSRKYLNKLISDFYAKHDPSGLNFSKIDGSKDDLGILMRNLNTISFLSKKRMVVASNFLEKLGKEDNVKEIAEKFLSAKDAIIVFFEEKSQDAIKKNALFKIFSKSGKIKDVFVYDYPLLQNNDLRKWIIAEARAEKKDIELAAIEVVIRNCGSDLWKISSELQKIIAFSANENTITKKTAEIFVENKLEENIFILTDAIGNKNIKDSIRILEQFFLNDAAPEYILTMLARHFRILIGARDTIDNNPRSTRDDLAKIMNIHPFAAGKSLIQAKKFNIEDLKTIYNKILEADRAQKTGKIDLKLALNMIVAKI